MILLSLLLITVAPSHASASSQAFAHYREAPKTYGHPKCPRVFRVPATGSMAGILTNADWVVIEAGDFSGLREGDVAVYWRARDREQPGRYVVHRVIRPGVASGTPSLRNPYPRVERFLPSEFVGVVRRAWRVK